MIEIKNRAGKVLWKSAIANTTHEALLEGISSRADLAGANLAGADLADADLADARNMDPAAAAAGSTAPKQPYVRKGLTRQEHAALYRERHPEVPVVPNLDQRILEALEHGGKLDMTNWHTCDTTHCRAGWAIHLAGEKGYELEKKLGHPAAAGRMIYRASTGRSPHFFATDERALEDLRRCAAEDAAP